jgi:hypothetical protein
VKEGCRQDQTVVFRGQTVTSLGFSFGIEPWANEVELAAGASHQLVLAGSDQADIEVEVEPSVVTIYGWVGSDLDRSGIRSPPTPPASTWSLVGSSHALQALRLAYTIGRHRDALTVT